MAQAPLLGRLRFRDDFRVDTVVDVMFVCDVFVKFRTSYRDHGYDVTSPKLVARKYISTWLFPDLVACSAIPIEPLLADEGQVHTPPP